MQRWREALPLIIISRLQGTALTVSHPTSPTSYWGGHVDLVSSEEVAHVSSVRPLVAMCPSAG